VQTYRPGAEPTYGRFGSKADDSPLSSASSAVPRMADIGALWRVSRIMHKT
jgi:hypothetical protein